MPTSILIPSISTTVVAEVHTTASVNEQRNIPTVMEDTMSTAILFPSTSTAVDPATSSTQNKTPFESSTDKQHANAVDAISQETDSSHLTEKNHEPEFGNVANEDSMLSNGIKQEIPFRKESVQDKEYFEEICNSDKNGIDSDDSIEWIPLGAFPLPLKYIDEYLINEKMIQFLVICPLKMVKMEAEFTNVVLLSSFPKQL